MVEVRKAGAPSLYQLATNACIKNINEISDVGDLPYDRVKDVLRRVQVPAQLRRIETNSNQLIGEDGELWLAFIKRDIPQYWLKKTTPDDPTQWHKLYFDLWHQSRADLEQDALKLRATMEGIKNEKANHTSRLVDISALPNVAKHTRVGKAARGSASASTSTSGTVAAPKAKLPKFLAKARQEIKERDIFAHRRRLIQENKTNPLVINNRKKVTKPAVATRGPATTAGVGLTPARAAMTPQASTPRRMETTQTARAQQVPAPTASAERKTLKRKAADEDEVSAGARPAKLPRRL